MSVSVDAFGGVEIATEAIRIDLGSTHHFDGLAAEIWVVVGSISCRAWDDEFLVDCDNSRLGDF